MKTSSCKFALLFIIVIASPLRIHSQSDVDLSNVSACSAEQVKDWSFVREKMLGVAGRDLTGHEVGFFSAKKRIVINLGLNWFPISGFKETLCGTLSNFSFYPGIGELDREEDWNNFIIPDEDFKFLITDVQKLFPKALKSSGKCGPDKNIDCIEVEVTVHDNFFENPYFKRNEGHWWEEDKPASQLTNQRICTYGTWIRERVHEDHPELHPSELFWWTVPFSSGAASATQWFLMAIQDNSRRFNLLEHYGPEPVTALPWAGSPRTNSFKLALEIKPGDPTLNFRIKQLENHGVAPSVEDTGTTHVVRYNGSPLISLTEEQATENVGVRFDFCRDESTTRFLGYAELISRLQTDNDGDSGYQVLQVTKEEALPAAARAIQQPITQTAANREAAPRLEIIADSLKRILVKGEARLVANMRLTMPPSTALQRNTVKKVQLLTPGKKENVEIQTGAAALAGQPGVLMLNVPVGFGSPQKSTKFEVETPQGTQTFEIGKIALVPELNREDVLVQSIDEGALQSLLTAAGSGTVSLQPETSGKIRTAKADQLTVDVIPSYAPMRQAEPAQEEDGPITALLNGSVRKAIQNNDYSDVDKLFNSKVPFKMTNWTFKAVNLSTGAEVPVREVSETSEAAEANEVRVVRGSGSVAGGNLKVLFPRNSQRAIYELQMRATMTDANGYTGTFEHRVWSHFIPINNQSTVDEILRLLTQQAGASYDAMSQLSLSSNRLTSDAATRGARMFRTLALQAIKDNKVTLEELQTLTRAAKLAAEG